MAKKKMIVVDYDKELTPVTLAVKEDKKKASIFGIVWIVLRLIILKKKIIR